MAAAGVGDHYDGVGYAHSRMHDFPIRVVKSTKFLGVGGGFPEIDPGLGTVRDDVDRNGIVSLRLPVLLLWSSPDRTLAGTKPARKQD
jgi:hypothetical protein